MLSRACRQRGGCGSGRSRSSTRNRTPLPTGDLWRPTDGLGIGSVELLEQGGIRQVRARHPGAVLRSVTHPVHQVVESPPAATDLKDPVDLPDQIAALQDAGQRQRAGGHRLDLGHMEHWVDLEGGWKG